MLARLSVLIYTYVSNYALKPLDFRGVATAIYTAIDSLSTFGIPPTTFSPS